MKIEFKIKDDDKTWEDTPVFVVAELNSRSDIFDFAINLTRMYDREIRWNFEGLSQGHYVKDVK